MYNGAQASCIKTWKRADCLALTEITNCKESVKQKKLFAKMRLSLLMNCTAKYLKKFCLISRSYHVVGYGVINSQIYTVVIFLISWVSPSVKWVLQNLTLSFASFSENYLTMKTLNAESVQVVTLPLTFVKNCKSICTSTLPIHNSCISVLESCTETRGKDSSSWSYRDTTGSVYNPPLSSREWNRKSVAD